MNDILKLYNDNQKHNNLLRRVTANRARLNIRSLSGSSCSFTMAASMQKAKEFTHLVIMPNREKAAYIYNDIEQIFQEHKNPYEKKNILFFPSYYKKPYASDNEQKDNLMLRTEALNRLLSKNNIILVTYPEALMEKVVKKENLKETSLNINLGETLDMEFLIELLEEMSFDRVELVVQAGQYAVRGGIVDVYSYASEYPYRIEFFDQRIESLRSFDVVSQLTKEHKDNISLFPDIERKADNHQQRTALTQYLPENTIVWIENPELCFDKIEKEFAHYQKVFDDLEDKSSLLEPKALAAQRKDIENSILSNRIVEIGSSSKIEEENTLTFNTSLQPSFNRDLTLLKDNLIRLSESGIKTYFFVESPKQKQRIEKIIQSFENDGHILLVDYKLNSLYSGFVDYDLKIALYSDHELFERYHNYRLRDQKQNTQALTLKEIQQLHPGDYITHIDYGVGKFSGLEKLQQGGKTQEAVRLIYADGDILYVSIHSLHKISRYIGKDGTEPSLHRLGSNTWKALKQKTKQRIKDIAKDLIDLYAKRQSSKGYAFSGDNYLQAELEASFLYQDTPDQNRATKEVKRDMEKPQPMDRLICGDVGFGKTEVAIRAAFKAVCDSKQVAVLVPTTILAYQHFKTFSQRLHNMPCRVEYINRFRSPKDIRTILADLKEGRIDIIIGTHKLLSPSISYRDLGLFIIDEEHKFGVATKEKLRKLKVNIDTLTLTATPIPRTLQFSLLGIRDLSLITTPPANRQPVETNILPFSEDIIKEALEKELSRSGQCFFVHNRVQTIEHYADLIRRLVPKAVVKVAHGELKGDELENIIMEFLDGQIDILVSTTIVENGLDVPNANTIVINDAHLFGLSDLHQLRGRVGRSNQKAFCFLLTPPQALLTEQAQKRLKAVEDFAAIGSGFSIAMRDLDIRGSGNILGAEQSGFISQIGLETYQKILAEAIEELKDKDYYEIFHSDDNQPNSPYTPVKDCHFETDLELYIPSSYVSSTLERLSLYKELEGLKQKEQLSAFLHRLQDRFGKPPKETTQLVEAVLLRQKAMHLGIDKLIIRSDKMIAHIGFTSQSPYFDSPQFSAILQYLNTFPLKAKLVAQQEKASLQFSNVTCLSAAFSIIEKIEGFL